MIINRINTLAPQLLRGFGYDHHKTLGALRGGTMKVLLELHIRVLRPELAATLGRGVHLTNKIVLVDAEAL